MQQIIGKLKEIVRSAIVCYPVKLKKIKRVNFDYEKRCNNLFIHVHELMDNLKSGTWTKAEAHARYNSLKMGPTGQG